MPIFAQVPDPGRMTAEQIAQIPFEQAVALKPEQLAGIAKRQEELRWLSEWSYFQKLHQLLPEPFFQTEGFLLFFVVVAGLYWFIPRKWNSARVWLLVIASFHFYAAWNASLAFLVTATATLDYFLARGIGAVERRRLKQAIMIVSIAMNLGVLAYFKYRGFFVNELHDMLTWLGGDPSYSKLSPLNVLIPFGISFYTFEAISYAVDVYRGKVKPERSLPHFMLFILFFPHLVAGPIVRAGDFLRQAHRIKRWNWVRVQVGVQFVLLGLFKKLAIADRMALFCDPVLANPAEHNAVALWLGVLAYAFRIYADFSGYSDMAVGTAHLFGFKLTQNFLMPYLSPNVSEFWRRWHISLSTWLRDYVFIPLGGSRGSAWATDRNLMITMLLGGLWHGSTWSYVVWGGLHGAMLIAHRHFRTFAEARPRLNALLASKLGTIYRTLLTFSCVSLCWVFFRPDLDKAWIILQRMFTFALDGNTLPLHNRSLWYTVLFVLICHLLATSGWWDRIWARTPPAIQGYGYALTLSVAMLLAPESGQTFIYFTF
ncbi:MAG: MBOAT family O-acyltransferase [Fimbriiglobus sp.]